MLDVIKIIGETMFSVSDLQIIFGGRVQYMKIPIAGSELGWLPTQLLEIARCLENYRFANGLVPLGKIAAKSGHSIAMLVRVREAGLLPTPVRIKARDYYRLTDLERINAAVVKYKKTAAPEGLTIAQTAKELGIAAVTYELWLRTSEIPDLRVGSNKMKRTPLKVLPKLKKLVAQRKKFRKKTLS